MIDNPLTNILIRANVINREGIEELLNHVKSAPQEDLSVFDVNKTNKSGEISWSVDKKTRDTQIISPGDLYPKIEDLFRNTVKEIINPFYGVEVNSSEVPQILSYSVGGHYLPHIDGESIWVTPNQEKIWKKSTDRDLSMVFFLNNDFEGGDFIFPDYKIRVRPEPGLLICFPSNHNYVHGVEPVTKGKRYSIVTWATIKGFESMEEQNKRFSEKYGVIINN
jgi:predicted 2-oxoglutarate/Fe(II)-dependent dioxygenase YbiX